MTNRTEKAPDKKRRSLSTILLCFFLAVFVLSASMIVKTFIDNKNEQDALDALANKVVVTDPVVEPDPDPVVEPTEPAEPTVLAQYADLYAENPDLGGWLKIEDTKINFPVMYTPKNPTYYIHKGFDKKYSHNGLPFIGYDCSLDPRSDNIIIHGHNMKSGAMFACLTDYEDEAFWQTHQIIEFDTVYQQDYYEIIAVFRFTVAQANKAGFYDFTNAEDEAAFDRFVSYCKEMAMYDTGVTATYGDKLLTLSTCSYHAKDGRLVIVARQKASTTE